MRAGGLAAIAAVVSIAVLAGCGATARQTHPASTWATSYCSALNDWLTTVESISRGSVDPNQALAQGTADLEMVAGQVSQASNTLSDALLRAGRPETAGAPRVLATVTRLAATVKARGAAANRAAKSNDRSALAGFRRLHTFTGLIDSALTDILSADATIRRQDATLAHDLDSSRACRDFHSSVENGTRSGNQ